jgi:hypothetical protein
MDHQHGVSDAAAKVGETVSDLAAKTEKIVQDNIDQGKPVLRDLQASAGAAIDKAAGLVRDASSAELRPDAKRRGWIQELPARSEARWTRPPPLPISQSTRAGDYVSDYGGTAAGRSANRRCY